MTAASDQTDFLIDRTDLRRFEWAQSPRPELASGEVELRITAFAFTSNNLSYAKFGERIGYWRFFPAPAHRGRIPVWGLGTVTRSRCDTIAVGERIYGYLPMSSHALLRPGRLGPRHFIDEAPHRACLPHTYNEYRRLDHDPGYDSAQADIHLVLRPLFSLSYFLAEFLRDECVFGASRVVVTSASSKTALGLAHRLRTIEGVRVIGLTSPANLAFVQRGDAYHKALGYGDIDTLTADAPIVIVDIAGSSSVLHALHERFGSAIRHSCLVGATHEAPAAAPPHEDWPGPKPTFFFTPDHILARRRAWGEHELAERLRAAWQAFAIDVPRWLTFRHSVGRVALEQVYREVAAGTAPPHRADILAIG